MYLNKDPLKTENFKFLTTVQAYFNFKGFEIHIF